VLQEQALNIAQIALLGVVLGMLIDMYRVMARLINPGRYLAAVFDLLFWLACTLWAFVYLLQVNSGEARLYVLALLFGGFLLEQKLLGSSLRANLRAVLLALGRGINKVIEVVSLLLEAILDAICAPFRFIVRLTLRPLVWLISLVVKPARALRGRLRSLKRRLHATLTQWWEGEEPKEL